MRIAQNPRELYLTACRKSMPEARLDFYSKHKEAPFIKNVRSAFARKEAPSLEDIRRILLIGNARQMAIINDFQTRFRVLSNPDPGRYHLAKKECVDARASSFTIYDHLEMRTIHERTAAAIVRNGHVFMVLDPRLGIGLIIGHSGCGGEEAAHKYHTYKLTEGMTEDTIPTVSDDIMRIVTGLPAGVAVIKDSLLRTQWNARVQALVAGALLQENGMGNPVYPVMVDWSKWPKVDVHWLYLGQAREHAIVTQLRESVQMLWVMAKEEGRDPLKQFAHTIVYYDPYRLGRINNPRAIFDELPNGLFCVTENFDDIMQSKPPSPSALGSIRYAAFVESENYNGHVLGVGKENGNRHVMILDTDASVALKAKEALLASSPDIRDLTRNGETIILALYNLETHEVRFI